MMEDFNRLVDLLLPTFLRRPKMLALLRALIGFPLMQRNSEYGIWQDTTRYEASITPQVCSLRHSIEQKYDVHCDIIELDGQPYDYLVEIDRSTDYNSIEAFLQKHGPAGKTFLYHLGDTTYMVTWSDFVEYDEVTTYEATWQDFEAEDDGIIKYDLFFYKTAKIEERKVFYTIEAIADSPINEIYIAGIIYNTDFFLGIWKEFKLEFNGTSRARVEIEAVGEETHKNVYTQQGIIYPVQQLHHHQLQHTYYVRPDELQDR